jgi:hypothetical protein
MTNVNAAMDAIELFIVAELGWKVTMPDGSTLVVPEPDEAWEDFEEKLACLTEEERDHLRARIWRKRRNATNYE